eukprot:TRINITY_DN2858_c0_g1_i1.p1 TRINITY_DN2858_c0_g1~~TRINITY_DN2858_c0_g1_i1.p1  ORF type:complete len:187 (-),score=21.98 TRINITY_DN2858_c0_g1_i1:46-606(-)
MKNHRNLPSRQNTQKIKELLNSCFHSKKLTMLPVILHKKPISKPLLQTDSKQGLYHNPTNEYKDLRLIKKSCQFHLDRSMWEHMSFSNAKKNKSVSINYSSENNSLHKELAAKKIASLQQIANHMRIKNIAKCLLNANKQKHQRTESLNCYLPKWKTLNLKQELIKVERKIPVSYTHLTLPTICSV